MAECRSRIGILINVVNLSLYLMGEDVSLVIVPDAGHVCNVDNKNFFNRCSLDFLKNF